MKQHDMHRLYDEEFLYYARHPPTLSNELYAVLHQRLSSQGPYSIASELSRIVKW